jgi:segregation and condensation protein A
VNTGFQPTLDFEAANEAAEDGAALVIDIDGYEGPLHVLLALARSQKVDLLQLSITKLAEQYLAFVHAGAARAEFLAGGRLSRDGRPGWPI